MPASYLQFSHISPYCLPWIQGQPSDNSKKIMITQAFNVG